MKGSRKWVNATVVGVLLLVLALLVFQIYNYFFLSLKTEYAVEATMEDTFEIRGVVCRTEHTLADNVEGYHDIILEDGEKVSKGGTIAHIYGREADVKAREEIRVLQAEVDSYTAAIAAKTTYSGDYSAYEQSVQQSLSEYAGALQSKDAFAAQEALSAFEKNVFIKEIVTGDNEEYKQEIATLQAKISELEGSISGAVENMAADSSGFYSRSVDGYESSVTPEIFADYSIEQYNKLIMDMKTNPVSPTENVGKIVSDYNWQYYFVVPASTVKNYKVGDDIYFRFPSVTDERIGGEIISLKNEADNVLVGVQCNAVHSEFLSLRTLEGVVITKTYAGIRVDKNSVRLLDGKSGVYVKVGQIIKFKKADVLYMGTTYALLDPEGSVVGFDEVIVGGKNLYDGKTVS